MDFHLDTLLNGSISVFATQPTLLGFLSVIAVELLQLTYLHRTQPTAAAIEVLNPLQLKVLKAKSPKLPKLLTVSWAVEAVARLGGYLEHRCQTPIVRQSVFSLHDSCHS